MTTADRAGSKPPFRFIMWEDGRVQVPSAILWPLVGLLLAVAGGGGITMLTGGGTSAGAAERLARVEARADAAETTLRDMRSDLQALRVDMQEVLRRLPR